MDTDYNCIVTGTASKKVRNHRMQEGISRKKRIDKENVILVRRIQSIMKKSPKLSDWVFEPRTQEAWSVESTKRTRLCTLPSPSQCFLQRAGVGEVEPRCLQMQKNIQKPDKDSFKPVITPLWRLLTHNWGKVRLDAGTVCPMNHRWGSDSWPLDKVKNIFHIDLQLHHYYRDEKSLSFRFGRRNARSVVHWRPSSG